MDRRSGRRGTPGRGRSADGDASAGEAPRAGAGARGLAFSLRARDERSCTLEVRAQPGSRRPGIAGTWNGLLKVAVRAPAQDGRANAELVLVLAEALGLRRADVVLEGGATDRRKRFLLAIPEADARRRLQERLPAE